MARTGTITEAGVLPGGDDARVGRLLTRREALALLAVAALPGGARAADAPPSCVARPEQTEGPYFVDGALERPVLRDDRQGAPLELAFAVSSIAGGACTPLGGAQVDVWHCDAAGAYSGVGGAAGTRFLRGWQATDRAGRARFSTIVPGWYPGRAVHVHFKVRTVHAGKGREFTSQLYFDEAFVARVFAGPPYAERRGRWMRNAEDFIFTRDGGRSLVLDPRAAGSGHAANFSLALDLEPR